MYRPRNGQRKYTYYQDRSFLPRNRTLVEGVQRNNISRALHSGLHHVRFLIFGQKETARKIHHTDQLSQCTYTFYLVVRVAVSALEFYWKEKSLHGRVANGKNKVNSIWKRATRLFLTSYLFVHVTRLNPKS